MGKDGNECDAEKCFGYMVKYSIRHLNQCFIGDKVDGNISMKGDGHVGGSLLRTAPNSIAYGQISISGEKNTPIGPTALDGSQVINIRVKSDGDPKNEDTYLFTNSGPEKYFLAPPTCQFGVKEIPFL